MSIQSIEKRVALLEDQIGQLREELRSARGQKPKDWRRTIGAFTNDDGMLDILRDAMRLREADRKRTRSPTR
jgi:hypothetical protein